MPEYAKHHVPLVLHISDIVILDNTSFEEANFDRSLYFVLDPL